MNGIRHRLRVSGSCPTRRKLVAGLIAVRPSRYNPYKSSPRRGRLMPRGTKGVIRMNMRKRFGGRLILPLAVAALALAVALIAILGRDPQQAPPTRGAPSAALPETSGGSEAHARKSAADSAVEPLDAPPDQQTQAQAGTVEKPGPMRLVDAEAAWQAQSDQYVAFLKDETFEQGLRRVYMPSEIVFTTGNEGLASPDIS